MEIDLEARNPSSNQTTNSVDTDSFEAHTHPFTIWIWIEETADEAGQATWRGRITHVPTGERRYVENLDDIARFIASYLEDLRVRPDLPRRIKLWWRRMLRTAAIEET